MAAGFIENPIVASNVRGNHVLTFLFLYLFSLRCSHPATFTKAFACASIPKEAFVNSKE
jgi:hypothetical protein